MLNTFAPHLICPRLLDIAYTGKLSSLLGKLTEAPWYSIQNFTIKFIKIIPVDDIATYAGCEYLHNMRILNPMVLISLPAIWEGLALDNHLTTLNFLDKYSDFSLPAPKLWPVKGNRTNLIWKMTSPSELYTNIIKSWRDSGGYLTPPDVQEHLVVPLLFL